MLNNIKIGTKLLIISILLVVVPLAVVTFVAVQKAGGAVTSVGEEGLRRGASFVASGLNHSLEQEQVIVTQLAANDAIVKVMEATERNDVKAMENDTPKAITALDKIAQSNQGFNHQTSGYLVLNTKGSVVISSNSKDFGRNFASYDFFKLAMEGNTAFGQVVADYSGTGANMPVAAPIYDSTSGTIIGVFMEQLSTEFVQNLVANAKVGKSGYAFVVDKEGLTIAHPDPKLILKMNVLKQVGLQTLGKDMLSGNDGIVSYSFEGMTKLAGYAPVKATGWGVGLTVPEREYLAPVVSFRDLAFIVAGIAVVLTVLILVFFVRSITRPLHRAVDYAKVVASGDFSHRLKVDRKDEIGVLTGTLDDMVDRLQGMILQIREAAEQTAGSSEEIASSAQQLASGAQNQASTLEETSASVEELTASVEQVSDHSQSQSASVEESSSNMEQMQRSVQQVSQTLGKVAKSSEESTERARVGMESVAKAVEAIKGISKSSEQIAGIINVISDIADQTNLLALNASIEAARAGEHGRGFAVVADEVSKLADRSSSSTKEIEQLIKESSRNVDDGVEIAQNALDAMSQIISGAEKTNEMVAALSDDIEQQINGIKEVAKATESISEMSQSISAATEEQTTNAKQVAKAVENVNELTQQAAAAAEEMSSATEELSALAEQMQRLVEKFKIDETARAMELTGPQEKNDKPVEPSAPVSNEPADETLLREALGQVNWPGEYSGDQSIEEGITLKKRVNGSSAHS